MSVSFNLVDQKWIPVLYQDGTVDRVGILGALEEDEDANRIRCVALASPLDLFAVHRFILTLLYWKAPLAGGIERIRESLLKEERVPRNVLNGIRKDAALFSLFDDTAPFLQDVSATQEKKKKSVGSLFAEFAAGTNIAHFHHGDDKNMRMCLSCVTLGMLRVVPWSQSGGQGLTPSVHNAPPIMAIAVGDSLALTLGLNLVPLAAEPGQPRWFGHFSPVDSTRPIPYLEAFTWNPRRILLPSPEEGTCWCCGQANVPTVGQMRYMKNENTKKRADKKLFEWRDPAAFHAPYDPEKKYDEQKNAPYKTLKSSQESLAAQGRDLPNRDQDSLPTVSAYNRNHESWLLIVPCTNPKYIKTYDHRQIQLSHISAETMRALQTTDRPPPREGFDGWSQPKTARRSRGIQVFVQAGAEILSGGDWAVLSNAAYRAMHDSPAAFDVFSGLYWGLRDTRISGLPSRNVAWLTLKLMAAVPACARTPVPDASFCPLELLPKRQIRESGRASPYPVSLPHGPRLEAALRQALDRNMRKRQPEPVDWIGFCYALDQLLD